MGQVRQAVRQCICFPIYAYRYLISPMLGPRCRFYPSCSAYACDAILSKGIIKGLALTFYRLLRCHPFSKGGYEPISQKEKL